MSSYSQSRPEVYQTGSLHLTPWKLNHLASGLGFAAQSFTSFAQDFGDQREVTCPLAV